jgi:hypothetical protein
MNRMVVKRRVFPHDTVLVLQTDRVTETDLEIRDAEGITQATADGATYRAPGRTCTCPEFRRCGGANT